MFAFLGGGLSTSIINQIANSTAQKELDKLQSQVNDFRAQSIETINAVKDAQTDQEQLKAIENRIAFVKAQMQYLLTYGKKLQPEAFTDSETLFFQATSLVPVAGQVFSRTIQGIELYRRDSSYQKQVADITERVKNYQAELKQLTDWYVELTDGETKRLSTEKPPTTTIAQLIAKYKWTAILVAVNLIAIALVIRFARKQ